MIGTKLAHYEITVHEPELPLQLQGRARPLWQYLDSAAEAVRSHVARKRPADAAAGEGGVHRRGSGVGVLSAAGAGLGRRRDVSARLGAKRLAHRRRRPLRGGPARH